MCDVVTVLSSFAVATLETAKYLNVKEVAPHNFVRYRRNMMFCMHGRETELGMVPNSMEHTT